MTLSWVIFARPSLCQNRCRLIEPHEMIFFQRGCQQRCIPWVRDAAAVQHEFQIRTVTLRIRSIDARTASTSDCIRGIESRAGIGIVQALKPLCMARFA